MKKYIALFGIFCLKIWAFGIDDLSEIKKENISGDFKQIKNISGFSSEITSSGSFSIANNEILWHTKKPIVSSVKITSEGIFLQDSQNNWVKSSQHYDKSLFLNIMKLDFKALESNFDFVIKGNKNAWNLKLLPKGIIKNIFKSIEIRGGEFVQSVVLIEQNNDRTENIFTIK